MTISVPVWVGHVTLGAAEKGGSVKRSRDSDFSWSVLWLLLFDFGFASAPLLAGLKHLAEGGRGRLFCLDVGFLGLHDHMLSMR